MERARKRDTRKTTTPHTSHQYRSKRTAPAQLHRREKKLSPPTTISYSTQGYMTGRRADPAIDSFPQRGPEHAAAAPANRLLSKNRLTGGPSPERKKKKKKKCENCRPSAKPGPSICKHCIGNVYYMYAAHIHEQSPLPVQMNPALDATPPPGCGGDGPQAPGRRGFGSRGFLPARERGVSCANASSITPPARAER